MVKMHRDTAVWGEDAKEFRPERFLSQRVQEMHPKQYMPVNFKFIYLETSINYIISYSVLSRSSGLSGKNLCSFVGHYDSITDANTFCTGNYIERKGRHHENEAGRRNNKSKSCKTKETQKFLELKYRPVFK